MSKEEMPMPKKLNEERQKDDLSVREDATEEGRPISLLAPERDPIIPRREGVDYDRSSHGGPWAPERED